MRKSFVSFLLLVLTTACGGPGTTYYVDSRTGSDDHTGTSMDAPLRTLEKLNTLVFGPGDRILFRAGTKYDGSFEPQGSGSADAPVVVDLYGEGAKPQLNGHGIKQHTLLLDGVAYWEVNNLEITNSGETPCPGRNGVVINASNKGEIHHVYLRNLTVHAVNGSCVKNEGAGNGIYWSCGSDRIPSRFVDLRIENCHVYNCQRNGITGSGNTDRDKWYPSLGVVIRGNLIEHVPGDGIVPIGCDGALVEWNIVRDSPDLLRIEDAAAGIWPWGSDNTVIQYNEVSGQNAKWDAQGFDCDYNCRNTVVRFNFSHDNAGGFLMICNEGNTLGQPYNIGTTGSRIYGNISLNDGLRGYPTRPGWFSPTIHISGPSDDSVIEENLIVVFSKPDPKIDRTLIEVDNWGGPWPSNLSLRNNTVWILDSKPYEINLGAGVNMQFENNRLFGRVTAAEEGFNILSESPDLRAELPFHADFPDELRKRVRQRLETILEKTGYNHN